MRPAHPRVEAGVLGAALLGLALTERERDVAPLLTEGYTNVEIAEQLYMGKDTAKEHARAPADVWGQSRVPWRRAFSRVYHGEGNYGTGWVNVAWPEIEVRAPEMLGRLLIVACG